MPPISPPTVRVGMWNMLASGMTMKEFMTLGGDSGSIAWSTRRDGAVATLLEMFEQCDVVVTCENDHFYWILNKLQEKDPQIQGVACIKGPQGNLSHNRRLSQRYLWEELNKDGALPDGEELPSYDVQYAANNEFFKSASAEQKAALEARGHVLQSFCQEHASESMQKVYGRAADDLYESDD